MSVANQIKLTQIPVKAEYQQLELVIYNSETGKSESLGATEMKRRSKELIQKGYGIYFDIAREDALEVAREYDEHKKLRAQRLAQEQAASAAGIDKVQAEMAATIKQLQDQNSALQSEKQKALEFLEAERQERESLEAQLSKTASESPKKGGAKK